MKELDLNNPIIEKYESLLDKNPRSKCFAPLAEVYRKIGLHERAMRVLKDGIQLNPSYAPGYLALSFCYFDLDQYELAYSTIRPFIDSNRDNLRMLKHFAELCLKLGRENEALDTFKYLLFINPTDEYVAKQVNFLQDSGNEIVINIKNDKELFNVEKIKSEPEVGNFDEWENVKLNNSVVENDDRDDEINHINNNAIRFDQDESPEKEDQQIINEDINNEADSPIITLTLVDLYLSQGHTDKAKEVLEKILELNPSFILAKEKLKEIQKLTAEKEIEPLLNEEEQGQNLLALIDSKVKNKYSYSDRKREKLYSFLEKIKARGQSYSESNI